MFLHASENKDVHIRPFKVHVGLIFYQNNYASNGDYVWACLDLSRLLVTFNQNKLTMF